MDETDDDSYLLPRHVSRKFGTSFKSPSLNSHSEKRTRTRLIGAARLTSNQPAELYRKDFISAMKVPDSEYLSPDDIIIMSDTWRQEWEKGVQVPVNPENTNESVINIVKSINDFKKKQFKMPKRYFHQTNDSVYDEKQHILTNYDELNDATCRYDLDLLDIRWLETFRRKTGIQLEARRLEKLIEIFEEKCHEYIQTREKSCNDAGIEYDDNTTCDVCRNPDVEEDNEIVFCDGCDVCVHQSCYGIQTVPAGSYYCRPCALSLRPKCELCPNLGGALKSTKSGSQWAHLSCAIWIPEVSIENPSDIMEPIKRIQNIPQSRRNLVCCLCKLKKGACIQCSEKTCAKAYHVTCAQRKKLKMNCEINKKGIVEYKSFCPRHSKNCSISDEDDEANTSIANDPVQRRRKIDLLKEEFYTLINPIDIANEVKEDVETIDYVYTFWTLKRKSNRNKPLLPPKKDDFSSNENDILQRRLTMFIKLRQNLERVRNLCYLVSRREKEKRRLIKLKMEIISKQSKLFNLKNLSNREKIHILGAHKAIEIYDDYDKILNMSIKVESEKFLSMDGVHDEKIITNKVNKKGMVVDKENGKSPAVNALDEMRHPFKTIKILPPSKVETPERVLSVTDNSKSKNRCRQNKSKSQAEIRAAKFKDKLKKKVKPIHTAVNGKTIRREIFSKRKRRKIGSYDKRDSNEENTDGKIADDSNCIENLNFNKKKMKLDNKLLKRNSRKRKSELVVKRRKRSSVSTNSSYTSSIINIPLRNKQAEVVASISSSDSDMEEKNIFKTFETTTRLRNKKCEKSEEIIGNNVVDELLDDNRRSTRLRLRCPSSPCCAEAVSTPLSDKKSTTVNLGDGSQISDADLISSLTDCQVKLKIDDIRNIEKKTNNKRFVRCLRSRVT